MNVSNPAVAEESFNPGAGNEEMADGSANAEFFAKFASGGFGKTQEMAEFPIVQAVALAGQMAAVGQDGFDDGIEGKVCHGGGIVDLARPETQFTPGADAAGDVPDPEKTPALNEIINLGYGTANDTRNGVDAAESCADGATHNKNRTRRGGMAMSPKSGGKGRLSTRREMRWGF